MGHWLRNLLIGAGSVFEIAPPPRRHRFNGRFVNRTTAESFRLDARKVGADFAAVISADDWQMDEDGTDAGGDGTDPAANRSGRVSGRPGDSDGVAL